jgi:hypothetical protein
MRRVASRPFERPYSERRRERKFLPGTLLIFAGVVTYTYIKRTKRGYTMERITKVLADLQRPDETEEQWLARIGYGSRQEQQEELAAHWRMLCDGKLPKER